MPCPCRAIRKVVAMIPGGDALLSRLPPLLDPGETDERRRVVEEARSWIDTPYHSNAGIKGVGVDCGWLPIMVFRSVGILPPDWTPGHYPPQWHMHRDEERYLNYVREFAHEVPGPPDRAPLPGDVVMFKFGRVFSHSVIVTEWPMVIHAASPHPVREDTGLSSTMIRLEKKYFSPWPRKIT